MSVTIQLPPGIEEELRHDLPNLDAQAKEALLVSLYRQGKLSHIRLAQLLALDRFQTEQVLRKHHVIEDLGTSDEYLSDLAVLDRIPGSKGE